MAVAGPFMISPALAGMKMRIRFTSLYLRDLRGPSRTQEWPCLDCTSGALDTTARHAVQGQTKASPEPIKPHRQAQPLLPPTHTDAAVH